MSPPRSNAPHRLIVEGPNDKWAIIALTTRHGWDWDRPDPRCPYVEPADGVERALAQLPTTLKGSYTRIGLVVDADEDLPARWQAVRDRFASSGVTLPPTPDPNGTIVEDGSRKLGVWLMPDNQLTGKLEDFLAWLIPSGDPRWPLAQTSTGQAAEAGAPFGSLDRIKAEIHCWLAWQEEPGQPFGTAITARTFTHDAALAAKFVGWMERLYA